MIKNYLTVLYNYRKKYKKGNLNAKNKELFFNIFKQSK